VSPKFYIKSARVIWRIGKFWFAIADWAGELLWLQWSQRGFDWAGDICMGWSAKLLMKGYWDIDPDNEPDL
jgi:hypothetical protein